MAIFVRKKSSEKLAHEKYANALLYFIKYCNNEFLGVTKLNKLMYYLDFISYRDRKQTVTGDEYLHVQYGPVPESINLVLTELNEKGQIQISREPYKDNNKVVFELSKEPNLKVFDEYEMSLLNNICKEFSLWPTDKIVEQTHLEAPWFYSKPFKKVDFGYSKDIDFFTAETKEAELA